MIAISTNPTTRITTRIRRSRFTFDAVRRLCEHLGSFMEAHGLRESKAYIALGNGTPELYVVGRSVVYDFDLGDRLSEFAAPYIERGLLGSAALIAASSSEELAAYFDLDKVIRIALVD